MPENASATDFGTEVLWLAGVVIGATIVISATRMASRSIYRRVRSAK
jgi:hypothetical protein